MLQTQYNVTIISIKIIIFSNYIFMCIIN